MTFRVGNGFDVHRFSDDPERRCVLGGVTFDDAPGLAGNSDADVVAHAVAEALLGAAGLDDIGTLFPDDDERWRGADSLHLLAAVVSMVGDERWHVVNVDCSVIAERPKLSPHRRTMEAKLSSVVGGPVTVKGRRAESLGALGRAEGVACFATALLTSIEAVLV
jgi:2-C-methyl-D-erythritol 2,4-cyclodiphosphate synthase